MGWDEEDERQWRELQEAKFKAYELGWREAAKWSGRDDLIFDIGSPAYLEARTRDLGA